jgi:hypothetical protein
VASKRISLNRVPTGDTLWLLALGGAFVVSRLLFHKAGIRFDMTPLEYYWQYMDPPLLKTRLLESVYYLHIQPPLFNLFLGVVLKCFPGHEMLAFSLIYEALGMTLLLSMFNLMRRLGIKAFVCGALCIAFMLSPSSILYENWLCYTLPMATATTLSAVALNAYLGSGRSRYAGLFFTLLAIIVLTRSLFHLAWFLGAMCVLLLVRRAAWRRIVLAALIPLIVICSVYVKNLMLFGSFSTSTWLGFSLSRFITFRLSEHDRRDLVARGIVSEFSLIRPFRSVGAYSHLLDLPETPGIPALDQKLKSMPRPGGNINLNNLVFVEVSRRYREDALAIVKTRPGVYLRSLAVSFGIFFLPASDYQAFPDNSEKIRSLETIYDRGLYGQFLTRPPPLEWPDMRYSKLIRRLSDIGFFIVAGFVVFLVAGWRFVRRPAGDRQDSIRRYTFVFIYLNVIYVMLVGNCIEIGENNRFRFLIDPLVLVGLGLWLNALFERVKTRSR